MIKRIEELIKENSILKNKLQQEKTKNANLKLILAELLEAFEVVKENYSSLYDEFDELQGYVGKITAESEELCGVVDMLEDLVEQVKSNYSDEIADRDSKIDSLQEEIKDLLNVIDEYSKGIDQLYILNEMRLEEDNPYKTLFDSSVKADKKEILSNLKDIGKTYELSFDGFCDCNCEGCDCNEEDDYDDDGDFNINLMWRLDRED